MDRAAMDELAAFLACAPEAGVFDLLYLRAVARAEAQARAMGKAAPEQASRAVMAVIAADRLRMLAALGRAPGRLLAALEAQAEACAAAAVGLMAPGLRARSVHGVAAYGRAWAGVLGCRGRVAGRRVREAVRRAVAGGLSRRDRTARSI